MEDNVTIVANVTEGSSVNPDVNSGATVQTSVTDGLIVSGAVSLPSTVSADVADGNTVVGEVAAGGKGDPGEPGVVQSIVAGTNVTVDDTDPANPVVSASGGGGGGAVDSVNGQTGVVVLDQDDIGDGTTYKQYSATEKTKLAGIEAGAEVNNISDANATDLTDGGTTTLHSHTVTKSDVGLGNVDNTSDANKPVSTATQTALDGKVDENASITGATKTKITYDAKGLVTSGADATTSDIGEGSNLYFTDERVDDRVATLIQDSTTAAPGITWTYDDATNTLTPEVAQTYQTYIFNSSGSQGGNRYNNKDDLIAALQEQGGPKILIFEQDEGFSSGTFDFTEVTLQGKGLQEYNAGGWTITFSGTATITGLWEAIRGIRVLSTTASSAVYSPSSAFGTWITDTVANIHSTNYPFISSSVSGQNIIAVRNSGRFSKLSGGVENIEFTGGAFAQTIILSMGDGAVVTDDTMKSTNAQVYIPIIGSVNQALANWPPSHTNLNVGFQMNLNLTNSLALLYTPTGDLTADNVQDAIDELETSKLSIADSSRVLNSAVTTIGNVGTGEDDLISYTLPANTLSANGDSIKIETSYSVVNNGNQKRVKFFLGGTAIFDTSPTGLAVSTSYTIKLDILIIRESAGNQKYSVDYTANGGLLGSLYGTLTKDETTGLVIKGTGETNAASNNDVTQTYMITKLQKV